MENINNIPFSFNRTTSKLIAKLGTSLQGNNFSDGITIDNVYCDKFKDKWSDSYFKLDDKDLIPKSSYCRVGILSLTNRILPDNLNYNISYELLNHTDIFKIGKGKINNTTPGYALYCKKSALSFDEGGLYSEFYYRNKKGYSHADDESNLLKYEEKEEHTYNNQEIDDLIYMNLPIFKNKGGKRITRDYDDQINPDNVVMLLDIKAIIKINTENSESMN
jgi:hypothetical protein